MPRVLIGAFRPIMRRGLQLLFTENGFEVISDGAEGDELVERLRSLAPDVCVLDRDGEGSAPRTAFIASSFPSLMVITVSEDDPEMQIVQPPGAAPVLDLMPPLPPPPLSPSRSHPAVPADRPARTS